MMVAIAASLSMTQAKSPTTPLAGPAASSQAPSHAVEDANVKAVLATVDALFAAFESGDAAAMLRQVYPDGRVTASGRRADGTSSLRPQSWAQFAERITPQRAFQERIANPTVYVDDDVAVIWAPFVVRVGGKVGNCGIDHFDLVRESGVWKVMNLTFSSHTTGCPTE
jgi:pyruvate/2-oxoglutarate dehydrogenase complex dihydrolipoamide acyltransferase (E2) component